MVNKQKLFKALKEEMEAKAAKKAAQRQLARLRHKVFSGELENKRRLRRRRQKPKHGQRQRGRKA